jgi:hypothetical protein
MRILKILPPPGKTIHELTRNEKCFRDALCDFVDRIIVMAKATIHESTRNRESHLPRGLL